MVFRDERSGSTLLPLAGALLSDQTVASISSFFNFVIAKLALRDKTAKPSFVVTDFSHALINSVLATFNVETIHNHLRRCINTLDGAYTYAQLKATTFIRLCASHAIKAFARSLCKLENSKQRRQKILSLFGILLNTKYLAGGLELFNNFINIFADPEAENSEILLDFLLDTNQSDTEDVDLLLENTGENDHSNDFLDEIDVSNDPIIHQSPFSLMARSRNVFLDAIIQKQDSDWQIKNPIFSRKIVLLLYKWFAYFPMWSSVLTDYLERYIVR